MGGVLSGDPGAISGDAIGDPEAAGHAKATLKNICR